MQIKAVGLPRSRYLERGAAELSREAQQRLRWFDYYQAHVLRLEDDAHPAAAQLVENSVM